MSGKNDSPDRDNGHQRDDQADLENNLEIVEPRHVRSPKEAGVTSCMERNRSCSAKRKSAVTDL
jgi:hypothetical protein